MADFCKRGRNWFFRFIDAEGRRLMRKGCPDKRATEEMARAAETKVAQRRAGLVDPAQERILEAATRPIGEHLAAFHSHLVAKGCTAKHADLFTGRARRVLDLAGVGRLADLNAPVVQSALAALRSQGRSLGTVNHHRAAIRGFSHWGWKAGLQRQDVLAGVSGYNAREDRRHDRRTLGLEELRRLIAAAHGGPAIQKMTGPAPMLPAGRGHGVAILGD